VKSTGPAFDDVAIVMITMNEQDSIRRVVGDLRRDVPGATVTIVDSSTDRTPEIAAEESVEVVRQFPPRGYGPAMIAALTHPDRQIVVTLDCDDTYPTERIPELVAMVRSGWDVVGATRLAKGRPRAMPWMNYLANRWFNVVASVVFMRRVRDVHSGMRAYARPTIASLPWYADAPALPVELLLLPIRTGRAVTEIPIVYGERVGDTTLNRFASAMWTLRRIWRVRTTHVVDGGHVGGGSGESAKRDVGEYSPNAPCIGLQTSPSEALIKSIDAMITEATRERQA
jgi:glycosyltransferase involved in cell wall biosynthesis